VEDFLSSPEDKRGWPWTVPEKNPPTFVQNISLWPRISIITPCYNSAKFLEETIRSILLQEYPNLEYIIIDGGSTDGSIDIIKKYEKWLSFWISESDKGMYGGINKGLAHSTGEIMAWSPANDIYVSNAFKVVGSVFNSFPQIEWLTSLYKIKWNGNSKEIASYKIKGFNKRAFFRGRNLLGRNKYAIYSIQQQSTFWKRSLWNRSGGHMNDKFKSAGDFELWARFYKHADLYSVDKPLGIFRTHQGQDSMECGKRYLNEQEKAFIAAGGKYVNPLEGWFRRKIFKRRPFRFLECLPFIGYSADIIEWNVSEKKWEVNKDYFF